MEVFLSPAHGVVQKFLDCEKRGGDFFIENALSAEEQDIYNSREFISELVRRRKKEHREIKIIEKTHIPYYKYDKWHSIDYFRNLHCEEDAKFIEDNYKTEREWKENLIKNVINYKINKDILNIYWLERVIRDLNISDKVICSMNKLVEENIATCDKEITTGNIINNFDIDREKNTIKFKYTPDILTLVGDKPKSDFITYKSDNLELLMDTINDIAIYELTVADNHILEIYMSKESKPGKQSIRPIKRFYTKDGYTDIKYKMEIPEYIKNKFKE